MATKSYSTQNGMRLDPVEYGSQQLYAPRGMMPPQTHPPPPAGGFVMQNQYPLHQPPISFPNGPPGSFAVRPTVRGHYYSGNNQPGPILNRNPLQSPAGYPPPLHGGALNPYISLGAPSVNNPYNAPIPQSMNVRGPPGTIPTLPPIELQRNKKQRPQTVNQSGQSSHYGETSYQKGILFPAKRIHHELMHLDYSDKFQTKPHPHYPDHMTMVRIRTPSQWGPSRLGTPTELRSTMTTIERYQLNPSKSAVSLEYEPYSHSDYLTMISKYQNMKLPKGLGPTDDERWQIEVKRTAIINNFSMRSASE